VRAAYNVADLLGRSLAGHPAFVALPLAAYLGLAVARLLFTSAGADGGACPPPHMPRTVTRRPPLADSVGRDGARGHPRSGREDGAHNFEGAFLTAQLLRSLDPRMPPRVRVCLATPSPPPSEPPPPRRRPAAIPVLMYLTGSWGILVAVFLVGITNAHAPPPRGGGRSHI